MDELDHNLYMAFERVLLRCRADPAEAGRRYRRMRAGGHLDRPNRAWCVAIRAADTRLDDEQAVDDPALAAQRLPHTVTLSAGVVRALGGPVWIPYPGVPLDVAAKMLGRGSWTVREWLPIRPGSDGAAREARRAASDFGSLRWQVCESADAPLSVQFVPAGALGRRGKEVPVVWSDGPLCPGADRGVPPSRWWGTVWRGLAERIDASFEQAVGREPVIRGGRFFGWRWVCPGLVGLGINGDSAPSPGTSPGPSLEEGGG